MLFTFTRLSVVEKFDRERFSLFDRLPDFSHCVSICSFSLDSAVHNTNGQRWFASKGTMNITCSSLQFIPKTSLFV